MSRNRYEEGIKMSLSSMLKGSSESDKKFQNIIKEILPPKEAFYTLSRKKPFSSEYNTLVENNLSNSYKVTLAGTAFDYMARFIIAKETIHYKENAFLHLIAHKGLIILKDAVDANLYKKLENRYIDGMGQIIEYIYSDGNEIAMIKDFEYKEDFCAFSNCIDKMAKKNYTYKVEFNKLLEFSCFLARLEHISRSKKLPEDVNLLFGSMDDMDLIADLKLLCNVFINTFLNGGILKKNSYVIYNPTFGICSKLCNGADADVFIDGILYDFKTAKSNGYSWKDTAQIISYYIFNCIADEKDIKNAPLAKYEIEKIALYKARFGEIEYFDTNKIDATELENTVDKLFDYFKSRNV